MKKDYIYFNRLKLNIDECILLIDVIKLALNNSDLNIKYDNVEPIKKTDLDMLKDLKTRLAINTPEY